MDVDCRWPGSCCDAKVYPNSSIDRKMQHKEILIIYKKIIADKAKITSYLFVLMRVVEDKRQHILLKTTTN